MAHNGCKFVVDPEIAELVDRKYLTADSIVQSDGRVTMFKKVLTCGCLFIADDSPDREALVGALPLHP